MFNWFKRKEIKIEKKEEVVEAKPLLVKDYPAKQYKVYWETLVMETKAGWTAEVRFISHAGDNLPTKIHRINGTSQKDAQQIADKHIQDQMPSYKR